MLVGLIVGAIVPIGLVLFMVRFGYEPALAVGSLATIIFMLWALARTYRRGVTQNIQLHPDRIVFDYITYKQEYPFSSASDWKLEMVGKNWCLTGLTDGSSKLIPVSAFPELQNETRNYYRR
jgi:hypothetical protein